jgi:DNA polymerase-3 subunit beta
MKIEVLKTDLNKAIKSLSRIAKNKNIPILQHVLLDASVETQKLTMTASDLDLQISIALPAQVTEPGQCTINAKELSWRLKETLETTIQIETTTERTIVRHGTSQFHPDGLPAIDFPLLPFNKSLHCYRIKESELKEMLTLANCATCVDSTRMSILGILLKPKNNELHAVATDGKRLAIVKRKLLGMNAEMPQVTIPNRVVKELIHLLKDTPNIVEVNILEDKVSFDWNNIRLIARPLYSAYPNYECVIPDSSTYAKILLDRLQLKGMIKRLCPNVKKETHVKLTLTECFLTLSTVESEASETIAIDYDKRQTTETGFNPKFLLEPLEALENSYIELQLDDRHTQGMSPGLIKTVGFEYIVMPVRMS